jgi:histone acetyltransferase 1
VEADTTGLRTIHRIHPKFTYPIFGEEERIFGYKGLDVTFRFAAHDLRPNIIISYDRKFPAIADTAALDIRGALEDFIPPGLSWMIYEDSPLHVLTALLVAFAKATEFEKTIQNDSTAKEYQPPGKLIKSYSAKGRSFEIWSGSLLDSRVRETIERMQIFISFFIEAGTPINTIDADWTLDRWTVYFVYEKGLKESRPNSSPYTFIGYATTYRFYTFRPRYQTILDKHEDTSLSDMVLPYKEDISIAALPSRLRISQFLILPHNQSSGHGSALYNAIYSNALSDSTVRELTVEDPSEEFDMLRDINDWKTLEPKFADANIRINTSPTDLSQKRRIKRLPTPKLLPVDTLRSIRSETKIAPRQFARQLEMYLLSLIPFSHRAEGGANLTRLLIQKSKAPDSNDKFYYWWRLILKQRIFKKNRDILLQLEGDERHQKIDEAARAQEDEYEKLLLIFATSRAKMGTNNGDGETAGKPLVRDRKRKFVLDEDEDEDEVGEVDVSAVEREAKIAKQSA